MFAELMPVIQDRPLTITVAALADGKIKICVVPQSQDKDTKINRKVTAPAGDVAKIPDAAIRALTTPLAMTGTPQELDAGFAEILTKYADVHAKLQHGIEHATQEITDALKALDERKKSKGKPETKKDTSQGKDAAKIADPTDVPGRTNGVESQAEFSGTLPLAWCAPAPTVASANDQPSSTAKNVGGTQQ